MKKQLRFIIVLLPLFLQAQYSHFEDGTLDSWTNSDNSTTALTNQPHSNTGTPGPTYSNVGYLLKTCDGTNSVNGQMSIKSSNFSGNILIGSNGAGTFGVAYCDFLIRNTNSFDLHLRIVLTGPDNAKIVSTNPIIIPAGSPWMYSSFPIDSIGVFTLFPGTNPTTYVDYVLADVFETEIIHSTALATEGEIITGMLEIDDVAFIHLLTVKEFTQLNVKTYPNPVVNQLHIKLPNAKKGTLRLTSIDGKQLMVKEFNTAEIQLDMSKIKSKGIYFLTIETAQGILTKKIVKN